MKENSRAGEENGHPHAVGRRAANGWGLLDMSGNVLEWCWDGYGADYYKRSHSPVEDPSGTEGTSTRVIRGGAWNCEPGPLPVGVPVSAKRRTDARVASAFVSPCSRPAAEQRTRIGDAVSETRNGNLARIDAAGHA